MPTDELNRVIPVISALCEAGAVVSVDTMRAVVAQEAINAGAMIVNDVSGGLADSEILHVVAASSATYVAMHWRSASATMQGFAVYDNPGGVVHAVCDELRSRVGAALAQGVREDRLILDPGIGFAKKAEHNWELLRAIPQLRQLGFPLLIGASRKAFLGLLLASDGVPRAVDRREQANVALTVLLAQHQVWGVRVHDVRAARDALEVWKVVTQT